MKLDSKNAEAYKIRGDIRSEREEFSGALSDYDKAIKYNSLNATYFNARGMLKIKNRSSTPESLYDFNKAIEIDSNFAEAYMNRGTQKCKMKLYNDALKDYEKALKLKPQYKEVLQLREAMLAKISQENNFSSVNYYGVEGV